jgi:hypothetical protein
MVVKTGSAYWVHMALSESRKTANLALIIKRRGYGKPDRVR